MSLTLLFIQVKIKGDQERKLPVYKYVYRSYLEVRLDSVPELSNSEPPSQRKMTAPPPYKFWGVLYQNILENMIQFGAIWWPLKSIS